MARTASGRRQVAQVDRARMLPRHHPAPPAVVEVLRTEGRHAGPRPVGDPQVRQEPDQAAGQPDPVVQLPVLGPQERLVVAADLLDRRPAVHAQVHRVDRARPGRRCGTSPRPPRAGEVIAHATACWNGVTPSAAMMPPTLSAPVSRSARTAAPQVPGRQQGVPVHPGHDRVPGRLDRRVDPARDLPGRVGHHGDAGVGGRRLVRQSRRCGRGTDRPRAPPPARPGSPGRARCGPTRPGAVPRS